MARRQEQETAREEVSEAAPGIARMELPIRMPGLGHVNCYALLDDEGAAVVDPGLPGPASWRAIEQRLAQIDLGVKDVHTVIITHSHPDHFGGAARFAEEAGSKIIAHRTFGAGMWFDEEPEVSVDDLSAQSSAAPEPPTDSPATRPAHGHRHRHGVPARTSWGGRTPWGGRPPQPPLWMRVSRRVQSWRGQGMMIPRITHPVDHGDVIELAGREFHVHHTPGHTMDHFCLHDPDGGVFVSGDHVLPSITPHISGLSKNRDPLEAFFYALDRVGEIGGVKRVLPAHGHPFQDLRERAEAIKRHHRERLERIIEIGRSIGRAATVEEISQQLFKKRSWGPMAESETYAHLEHLRLLKQAERFEEGGMYRYEV